MTASSASWKHLDLPTAREDLRVDASFSEADAEQIMRGFTPRTMEDKWFIYYEGGWLRFHRSWTGAFIYALRLQPFSAGYLVNESWVNRDPSQYNGKDTTYDRQFVRYLIDTILLKKAVPFAKPSGASPPNTGGSDNTSAEREG
jgi:hypothetical protein